MKRLLILGGTNDAAKLAKNAAQYTNLEIIYSLAGRTKNPNLPSCETRIGGFGGIEGLTNYLREFRIDLVIDATHPFAITISKNVKEACVKFNLPYIKFHRTPWPLNDYHWTSASNYSDAAEKLTSMGNRIFLSIGTNRLNAFKNLSEKWFLIRAIEEPSSALLLKNYEIILERGPFDTVHEYNLLLNFKIDVLVSKNSGGIVPKKLQAAQDLGIPILMIQQPLLPKIKVAETLRDTLNWIERNI